MYNIKQQKEIQALKRVIRKTIKASPYGQCRLTSKNLAKQSGIDPNRMKDIALKMLESTDEFIRFEELENNRYKLHYVYELSQKSLTQSRVLIDKNIKGTYNTESIYGENMNFSNVFQWNLMSRMELIEAYLDAGLDIIPVHGKVRVFSHETWDREYRDKRVTILNYFAAHKDFNVGAQQTGEIVVVDVDKYPQMLELLGGEVFDTLISKSGGGDKYHWWFKNTANLDNALKCFDGTFDVLTKQRMYVVVPPSIHPKTGANYVWQTLAEPVDIPQSLVDLYKQAKTDQNKFLPQLRTTEWTPLGMNRVKRGITTVVKKEFPAGDIPSGYRQPALFSYGRHLYNEQLKTIEEVADILIAKNNEQCKPPKTHAEMLEILHEIQDGNHKPEYLKILEQRRKQIKEK